VQSHKTVLLLALAAPVSLWGQFDAPGSPRLNSSSSTVDDGDHELTQRERPHARTVHLRGSVALSTGGPPPSGTVVEMACRGGEFLESLTDRKGRFTLTWSSGDRMANEAGLTGIGAIGQDATYSGCDIRAVLSGYASKRSLDPGSAGRSGDLGVLVLYPADPGRGSFVSATSLEAPSDARKSYERAAKELKRKSPDLEKAVALLRAAVETYPDYAAAWTTLGRTHVRRRDFRAARLALEKAIAADTEFIEPYPLLSGVLLAFPDYSGVIANSERLLELRPGNPEALYYLALGLMGKQQFDQALTAAEQVTASSQAEQYPRAFHILGVVHTLGERFPAAARAFERYVELQADTRLAARMRALLTEWRNEGKIGVAASGAGSVTAKSMP